MVGRRMKIFLLMLICWMSASQAFSQEAELLAKSHDSYLLGLSYLQWSEQMSLQSGGVVAQDVANFSGYQLSFESEISSSNFGASMGLCLGQGKAAGGGNSSTISYQSGRQSWMSYGAFARVYQKLTGRIYLGLRAPLFSRKVQWPSSGVGMSAESGKGLNAGLLLELNIRVTKKLDFFQAVGPFSSADGATLLLAGLAYRF